MIFYQVMTAIGPQLVKTQAEAKAIDPKFTKLDVPVDAAGLMAFVNALLAVDPADDDDEPYDLEEASPAPPSPPQVPRTSNALIDSVQRTYNQINVEEFIMAIPPKEAYRIKNLRDALDTQEASFTKHKL